MSKDLEEYNKKRDFEMTQEPKGKLKESNDSLRFVVQHHIASSEHYDFRLELNGVLLSWAVPKGPSYNTKDRRLAMKVEDHPFDYRNFEGTIPKDQYGGGTVMIWDEGTWHPLGDPEEGLAKGELKFKLEGSRLIGNWVLIRWKMKSDQKQNRWLLIKERDDYAKDHEGISEFNTSIRTGRSMEEIREDK